MNRKKQGWENLCPTATINYPQSNSFIKLLVVIVWQEKMPLCDRCLPGPYRIHAHHLCITNPHYRISQHKTQLVCFMFLCPFRLLVFVCWIILKHRSMHICTYVHACTCMVMWVEPCLRKKFCYKSPCLCRFSIIQVIVSKVVFSVRRNTVQVTEKSSLVTNHPSTRTASSPFKEVQAHLSTDLVLHTYEN